jgi:hypothetical protein
MPRLAFMTIGILYEPFGQPRSQGFVDRIPGVFDAADKSSGFVARSKRDMETYQRSWGELEIPVSYEHIGDVLRLPSTMSIWEDLESVAAFAYHGAQGEAMSKRRDWFQANDIPEYAAWWISDDVDRLDPTDIKARFEHLCEHGPSPVAFNFKQPFDADGNPYKMNQALVKEKIAANGEL